MIVPPELAALPAFRTADARAVGLTDRDLATASTAREIWQVRRGWWSARAPKWPTERHLVRTYAEAADRPYAVPSHWSGAVVAGVPVHQPQLQRVHLRRIDRGRAQTRRHLTLHLGVEGAPVRELALPGSLPREMFALGALGMVVADLARVAVELTQMCPVSGLMTCDWLLHRGVLTMADLEGWEERLRGEQGAYQVWPVMRLVDGLRESPGESWAAWVCHALGYRLESQVQVVTLSGVRRLDLALEGEWVALEYDGQGKYAEGDDEDGVNSVLLAEKEREDDVRDEEWEVVRLTKRRLARPWEVQQRIEKARRRARIRHGTARRPPRGG
ncbi:hypothetical protein [Arsenicicoccus sp. oral taxon 190]|uniref:hypothetical protein n=1 Tax=Arsenicicoccus sp. oral taxon 190 TaxID=1658671 RepID=UPI00067A22D6|nr:hypothetical protein [Arsenicicoccus sp. oral taxon 190]AKT51255.1 hypothetical protein ADJ73_07905 [Arsenicicoccus sp. oral taxon 190]